MNYSCFLDCTETIRILAMTSLVCYTYLSIYLRNRQMWDNTWLICTALSIFLWPILIKHELQKIIYTPQSAWIFWHRNPHTRQWISNLHRFHRTFWIGFHQANTVHTSTNVRHTLHMFLNFNATITHLFWKFTKRIRRTRLEWKTNVCVIHFL